MLRRAMRATLVVLFLIGVTLCLIGGLPLADRLGSELGWTNGRLAAASATRLEVETQGQLAVWGTLIVLLVPISLTALDASQWRERMVIDDQFLSEPDIDRVYEDRRRALEATASPAHVRAGTTWLPAIEPEIVRHPSPARRNGRFHPFHSDRLGPDGIHT